MFSIDLKKIIGVTFFFVSTIMLGGEVALAREFDRFSDWCQNKEQLTPEARHTVEVLLEEAGTTECDRAEAELMSRTVLRIWRQEIINLQPLESLTNLTELYLISNEIENIEPLANLTNLTGLYLSLNKM
ncbi:hypothetical protein POG22_03755 [Geitlerinema sp. CS-897]|nr:hypothetical protein [Geitlerinema sp. CS-897]